MLTRTSILCSQEHLLTIQSLVTKRLGSLLLLAANPLLTGKAEHVENSSTQKSYFSPPGRSHLLFQLAAQFGFSSSPLLIQKMKEFEDFSLPPGLCWPIPHTADDKALRLSTREFLKAILTKRFP